MFQTNLISIGKYDECNIEFLEIIASLISIKKAYTFRNKFDENFDDNSVEITIIDQFKKLKILRIQNWIINLVSKSIQYYYRIENPQMEYTKKAIKIPCKLRQFEVNLILPKRLI